MEWIEYGIESEVHQDPPGSKKSDPLTRVEFYGASRQGCGCGFCIFTRVGLSEVFGISPRQAFG